MDDLDLLDSLFSDPPAVRWRREEAYLLKQDGLGSSPKKRKNKSPYGELKRVPVKATSRRGRVVVPCEAPAPETVDDELAKERRALRRKAKVLRQRERALVARESKARVVAESCAAATAAANAAAMISKRLATKLSKRTATLAALQDCLKLSPPLKHHQPPVVEVDAPKARRKKTGTSSTKKLAEPPPSADDEAASMPLEAVGWTQRLGGDVVELLPSDPIIVAWRELARDGTAASTTAPRRQRRRVRVLQYDADMEPCGEIQCDATITSAEEVLSSPRVFAAALVLDDSPSTPLAAGLAAGANKKNNCDHKPVFFEDFAGRRLRAWTMPSEEVGAALSTELSACFGEHVFPPSSSENLSRFVCGVVFRRRGDGAPLLKFVAARLDREKSEPPCGAFGPCAKTLALARVNPYAVVRVEHCLDCEAHETTTKHVPGTYARRFERLAAYVRRRAPHAIVVAANGPTRIGAFEVRCQGYLFRAPTLVHSKFGSEAFPAHADVVAILRAETTEARSEEEEEEEEEAIPRRVTITAIDDLAGTEVSGVLVTLLKPRRAGCAFPFDRDDGTAAVSSPDKPKRKLLRLGARGSRLRSWNKTTVVAWLEETAGLLEEEARFLAAAAAIQSGPDLLRLTPDDLSKCLTSQARRRQVVDAISSLVDSSTSTFDDGWPFDDDDLFRRCWEVEAIATTGLDGRCLIKTSAPRCVAATCCDRRFAPASSPLSSAPDLVVRLEPRFVRLRVKIEPPRRATLFLASAHHHTFRLSCGLEGLVDAELPADDYVLTAGWRHLALFDDREISVSLILADRADAFRRDLAARRLQLASSRSINPTTTTGFVAKIIDATRDARDIVDDDIVDEYLHDDDFEEEDDDEAPVRRPLLPPPSLESSPAPATFNAALSPSDEVFEGPAVAPSAYFLNN